MEQFKEKCEKNNYIAFCSRSCVISDFYDIYGWKFLFKLQKIQNIRMSGAEFDAILYGVTDEQRQLCEENPNITLTGTAGSCGWVEKTE